MHSLNQAWSFKVPVSTIKLFIKAGYDILPQIPNNCLRAQIKCLKFDRS